MAAGILVASLSPAGTAAAATDPLLDQQWALSGSAAGVDIADAWARSNGDGVVVAVLDTGVQLNHPDLAGNLWRNPRETAGNGRDDDGNGFVDDVHGANMLNGSANINDDNGHGTHTAGIVAAMGANGEGGSGVAPGAKIMAVKVLDGSMAGNTSVLAKGIRYAVDSGARILSVSINSDATAPDLTSAVSYASSKGATIVASSGNNGRNLNTAPSYPASSSDPAVIGVTATTPDGLLWRLGNLGSRAVDIAAPGDQILSTAIGSNYQFRVGTSMATPFVAGTLALMSAARPDLDQAALRDTVLATARRGSIFDALVATGALDAGAALRRLVPGAAAARAATPAADATPLRVTLNAGRGLRAGRRATLRWSADGDIASVTRWRVSVDGRTVASVGAARRSVAVRIKRGGRHSWRVVGLDAAGEKVLAGRQTFRVKKRA